MSKFEKYLHQAKELKMLNAKLISPQDIVFDIRAILKLRPCDQSFGIDVYKTARNLGLPCEVLQSKDDIQNRYGFVLLD